MQVKDIEAKLNIASDLEIDEISIESVREIDEAIIGLGQAVSLAFTPIFHSLTATMNQFADDLNTEIFEKIDWYELNQTLTMVMRERWEGETLTDWGYRLDNAGLLDNPDVRWMYQKECLKAVFLFPYRMVVRRERA